MIQNVAGQNAEAQLVNASTGAPFIGSVTVYVTIDGGSQALGSVAAGAATAVGNGLFRYAPSQAETNGALCAFTFIGSGAVPVTVQYATITAAIQAALEPQLSSASMLNTVTKATTLCSLAAFKQWLGNTTNKTQAISSLTSVGTVATAVCTGHGYQTRAFVVIAGVGTTGYNGAYLITVLDANTFTFPIAAATTSPATGSPSVTMDDGRYATMADDATAEFEQQLDVPFVQRSITETFSGSGKCQHALKNAPVVSIDSFTIDGSAVDSSTYLFDPETAIVTFTSGGFNCGLKNVVVTYTAGYDVQDGPGLPSDVYRAVLDLAKAIHDELVSNAIAASSVSIGPTAMVIKPSDYPQSVKRVLANWSGQGMRA